MHNSTINPHNPNLLTLKISLPMWTNDEIQQEIQVISAHISALKLMAKTPSIENNINYFKQKRDMLKAALRTRNAGKL